MKIWFESQRSKKSRLEQALKNYPFYDRPHKYRQKSFVQAQENFDYFMNVRAERLAYFQAWMRHLFNIDASLDASGASAISKWVDYNGELILLNSDEDEIFFPFYSKAWTPENPGYSVIFDLGIYIGEMIVAKRLPSKWALMQETPDQPYITKSNAKLVPTVFIQPDEDGLAPFNAAWGTLVDKRQGRIRSGALIQIIKQFLYVARISNRESQAFSPKKIIEEKFDIISIR